MTSPRSRARILAITSWLLLALLAPILRSHAAEPTIEKLTEQVVAGVAILAEDYGVREAVVFDHPLDRTAHLLAQLAASPAVRDGDHSTRQRLRLLEILVLQVQSADRRGTAVPEERTREVLDRSLALLDGLRLETSLEPGEPQPFVGTDTCETALSIGFINDFDNTLSATSDGSASCGASASSPDHWYRFVAPTTETVIFEVTFASFDAVLSLHSGCPGTTANELACNDDTFDTLPRIERAMTAGEEVRVRVSGFGGAAGTFTLSVTPKASITGFVTNAVTSARLGSVGVDLLSSGGFFLDSTVTNSEGFYRFAPGPGNYRVRTRSTFLDELYDNIPCESNCVLTSGDLVPVVTDQESRADFALPPVGSISGTVTETGTGSPLGGSVVARDLTGRFGAQTIIGVDGSYEISNLPPQGYRVRTITPNIDERWDNQRCELQCANEVGSVITVLEGQDTPNIDFVLDLAGSIQGTVTDQADGQPIADVIVQLRTEAGVTIASTATDTDGTYGFGSLVGANYRAFTFDEEYLNEAWDDIPCRPECGFTSGDLIAVTEGATTSGIDFALDFGGTLSGTITNASNGLGLFAFVRVFDSTGLFVASTSTQPGGVWEVDHLPPETYTVEASDFGFLTQLFDGIDCPNGCDPLDGTPVNLALSEERGGIDFELKPLGSLIGTVSDTQDAPLTAMLVLFDEERRIVTSTNSSSFDGSFLFNRLQPGTYFLTVIKELFLTELYDDLPCPGSCDATTGTPIVITADTTTEVDIVLSAAANLVGRVTHQTTGDPLQGVGVEILSLGGEFLTGTATDDEGVFSLQPQFLGDVKLLAKSTVFDDELFEEVPCEGGCDLSAGLTFNLTPGAKFLDVDFTLTGCGSPEERTVRFFLFKNPAVVEACRTLITGEDVTVGAGGVVTFRAGESIVLGDGFAVLSGGSFKAEIVPELAPAP